MCTSFMRWVYGCIILFCILSYLIYDASLAYNYADKVPVRDLGLRDNMDQSSSVKHSYEQPHKEAEQLKPQQPAKDHVITNQVAGSIQGVEILGEIVDSRKYAVYGATTQQGHHFGHAFYLPLTAKAWHRIGFHSIVVLIGTIEYWYSDPLSQHVLSHLRHQNASVVFLQSTQESDIMLSQVSRIFISNLLKNNIHIVGNPYLVTSDADIWPLDQMMYDLPNNKQIHSLNSECCGRFLHNGKHYKMIPMANIGMKLNTWIQVTVRDGLNPSSPSEIIRYLYKEFGEVALHRVQKGDNLGWYLDQQTISVLIQDYATKIGNHEIINYVPRNVGADRLDRSGWDPRQFGNKVDVHLPEEPFLSRNFGRILPLLNLLYGEEQSDLNWCIDYFEKFQHIMFS